MRFQHRALPCANYVALSELLAAEMTGLLKISNFKFQVSKFPSSKVPKFKGSKVQSFKVQRFYFSIFLFFHFSIFHFSIFPFFHFSIFLIYSHFNFSNAMKQLILFLGLALAAAAPASALSFPELSDGGAERYYKLYSHTDSRVLQDNGDGVKASLVEPMYTNDDATTWKFVRVGAHATDKNLDTFKIVSKAGGELFHNLQDFNTDNNRFLTSHSGQGLTFVFRQYESDEGLIFQVWCIEAERFLNQTSHEICAYSTGHGFSAVPIDFAPKLSTGSDPKYYHLLFPINANNAVIAANGKDAEPILSSALEVKDNQLFRIEGDGYNNFKIISKIDNLYLTFPSDRQESNSYHILAESADDSFSLWLYYNADAKFVWQVKNNDRHAWNNSGFYFIAPNGSKVSLYSTDGGKSSLKFIEDLSAGAPILSTGGSSEWYYIQFINNIENGWGFTAKGQDQNIKRQLLAGIDDQQFKLEGSSYSDFKVVSKTDNLEFKLSNNKITLAESQGGNTFSLLPHHANSPAAWVLKINSANALNPQNTDEIGSYGGTGNAENYLRFITHNDLYAGAPKLSTAADTTWYHLQFGNNGYVIASAGKGQRVIRESSLAPNDKQLFRLEGSYSALKIFSKDNLEFKLDNSKFILAESGGDLLSLAVYSKNSPEEWLLKLADAADNRTFNQQNDNGDVVGLYNDISNNRLKFIDNDEYIAANYAGAPKISTSNDPTWYHLQFSYGGSKIAANGENEMATLQSSLVLSENQQFRLEGSGYGDLKVISRAGNMELSLDNSNKIILVASGSSSVTFSLIPYSKSSDEWLLKPNGQNNFLNQQSPNIGLYGGEDDNRLKFIDDLSAYAPNLNEWYYIQFNNGNAITANGQDSRLKQAALEGKDEQLFKLVGSSYGSFKVVSKINNLEFQWKDNNDNRIFLVESSAGDDYSLAIHGNSPTEWMLKNNNRNATLNPSGDEVCAYSNDDQNNLKFIAEYEMYTGAPELSTSNDPKWYRLEFPRYGNAITANGEGNAVAGQKLGPNNRQLFRLEGSSYGSFKVISIIDNLELKEVTSDQVGLAAAGSGDWFSLASHASSPEVWLLKHSGGKFINDNGFSLYEVSGDDGNCVRFIDDAEYIAALYANAPTLSSADAPRWYYLKNSRAEKAITHQGMNAHLRTAELAEGGVMPDSQLFRFEGTYDDGVKAVSKAGGVLQYSSSPGAQQFYVTEAGGSTFRFIPPLNTAYGSDKWEMLYKEGEAEVVPIAPGSGDVPFNPPWQNGEVTIPLGGNTYVTSGTGTVSDAGITGWEAPSTVYSTFFKVSNAGSLSLSLWYVAANASVVKVTVGAAPEPGTNATFTGTTVEVTLPKPQASPSGDTVVSIGTFSCAAGYVRVDFQGVSKDGIFFATPQALGASNTAAANMSYVSHNKENMFYWGRRGPSVNIGYLYPDTDTAEWFYNEVTGVDGMDSPGSYFMVSGFDGGYAGIQPSAAESKVRVLFSVWAPFETDDPETIPDSLKVACIKAGDGVKVQMFGGEGSGTQTFIGIHDDETPADKQVAWSTGATYKFLTRIYPSKNVGFTEYEATDYISYFYDPAKSSWRLLAWLRRPKTTLYYKSAHSFCENFNNSAGHLTRKAYFGNQWIRLKNGAWKELTSGSVGVDPTGSSGLRLDYRGGADGSRFFLQNGGFFNASETKGTTPTRAATGTQPNVDFDELEAMLN
jgi:hypothetical protein